MKALLLGLVAVLGGCATGLQVTYVSDPPGAAIYEGGRPLGRAPVTINYTADATFKAGGCQRLRGTTARWVSGAEASIGWLDACASVGFNQVYSFRRPAVAGVEVDASYANQREAGNAAVRAAAAAALIGAQRTPAPAPLQFTPIGTPATNCRAYWVGAVMQTTCN